MRQVTIPINAVWVKIARSPLYWIVAALQGVSVSVAPFLLYVSGTGQMFPGAGPVIVPLCFGVILLVGVFYMRLGGAVLEELRKLPPK